MGNMIEDNSSINKVNKRFKNIIKVNLIYIVVNNAIYKN
jgi:hypothetical protein